MKYLESKWEESLLEGTEVLVIILPSGNKERHIINTNNKFTEMYNIEKQYLQIGYRIFK